MRTKDLIIKIENLQKQLKEVKKNCKKDYTELAERLYDEHIKHEKELQDMLLKLYFMGKKEFKEWTNGYSNVDTLNIKEWIKTYRKKYDEKNIIK